MKIRLLLLGFLIILSSCADKSNPKPLGYFRIDLPKKEYELFSSHCSYKFLKSKNVEVLSNDLKLEHEAIPDLKEAIKHCESVKDFVSRDLLQKILESEEEHVDHLETQLALVDKVGKENFLQSRSPNRKKSEVNLI